MIRSDPGVVRTDVLALTRVLGIFGRHLAVRSEVNNSVHLESGAAAAKASDVEMEGARSRSDPLTTVDELARGDETASRFFARAETLTPCLLISGA